MNNSLDYHESEKKKMEVSATWMDSVSRGPLELKDDFLESLSWNFSNFSFAIRCLKFNASYEF